MSKIAVVYWSGTGNTAARSGSGGRSEGKGRGGGDSPSSDFDISMVDQYDAIAFGCPAMGAEVLEEGEFDPMFESCKPALNGKKIALFGSYGWGDGEWMRIWEDDCRAIGANLACDPVICNEAPDDTAIEECKALGAALV